MAAILDSTRRVGIADNIAVLGHFRPEFSHNIVTTWTHVGTLGVLICSLVPWELVAYLPTLNTAHPGRRERFRRRNKMWSLQWEKGFNDVWNGRMTFTGWNRGDGCDDEMH
jgi:hypothetical protein